VAQARFTATVLLAHPPLPLRTAITRPTPGIPLRSGQLADAGRVRGCGRASACSGCGPARPAPRCNTYISSGIRTTGRPCAVQSPVAIVLPLIRSWPTYRPVKGEARCESERADSPLYRNTWLHSRPAPAGCALAGITTGHFQPASEGSVNTPSGHPWSNPLGESNPTDRARPMDTVSPRNGCERVKAA